VVHGEVIDLADDALLLAPLVDRLRGFFGVSQSSRPISCPSWNATTSIVGPSSSNCRTGRMALPSAFSVMLDPTGAAA